jgi:hypothetical protein
MKLSDLIKDLQRFESMERDSNVVVVIVGERELEDGDLLEIDSDVGVTYQFGQIVISAMADEEEFE